MASYSWLGFINKDFSIQWNDNGLYDIFGIPPNPADQVEVQCIPMNDNVGSNLYVSPNGKKLPYSSTTFPTDTNGLTLAFDSATSTIAGFNPGAGQYQTYNINAQGYNNGSSNYGGTSLSCLVYNTQGTYNTITDQSLNSYYLTATLFSEQQTFEFNSNGTNININTNELDTIYFTATSVSSATNGSLNPGLASNTSTGLWVLPTNSLNRINLGNPKFSFSTYFENTQIKKTPYYNTVTRKNEYTYSYINGTKPVHLANCATTNGWYLPPVTDSSGEVPTLNNTTVASDGKSYNWSLQIGKGDIPKPDGTTYPNIFTNINSGTYYYYYLNNSHYFNAIQDNDACPLISWIILTATESS